MTRTGPRTNPFSFGALALDDAFTDRQAELAELSADVRNGQDVVVLAPRRYGKTSLIWRAAQQLTSDGVLVAQADLMTTPTKAALAAKLARTIHDDLATPLFRAKERLRIFGGLRITPTVTVDPVDGSLSFSFAAHAEEEQIDATLERLLELPGVLAAERGRSVALVLDEFQEVVEIDRRLPQLMRAVFQTQPGVAHVYLGSRRHMMERIFNDENEPFWRSAKRIELAVIEPSLFRTFIAARFRATSRRVPMALVDAILGLTAGHPYATQQLCYFLWEELAAGRGADEAAVAAALERLLDSEDAHFGLIWQKASRVQRLLLVALAAEPGSPLREDYRRRHGLPGASAVQRGLSALADQELVARASGRAELSEPFLGAWLRRAI